MKTLIIAKSIPESDIIMNLLEENGISSELRDLGNASFMNIYGEVSLFGQEINVEDVDYEKARTLLSQYYGTPVEE